MNNKIVILEKEQDTVEILKSYVEDLENFEIDKSFDNYEEGIEYIKKTIPNVVVLSAQTDISTQDILLHLSDIEANIIILSSNYTTSIVIKALRAGAKDLIQKPVIKKDFITSLNKCCNKSKVLKKSNIITVFSNKGGIGKTTIATNLAVELSRQTREKVALVDLNFPLGDITTFINIKPSISLVSAIENSIHSGKEAILSTCKQYKDTSLYVLADPIYMEDNSSMSPTHVYKLFETLREEFSYVVVDISTSVDKINLKVLELSDMILLVSIVNLPLIRNCQRCLDLFNNLGYDENKTKIIINRYLENDEITIKDVEKVLHQKVYWKIPNNYFAIMSSINKAMPVSEINENSNVTLSFSGLASELIEDIISKDIME